MSNKEKTGSIRDICCRNRHKRSSSYDCCICFDVLGSRLNVISAPAPLLLYSLRASHAPYVSAQ